jgi:HAD superfamily hydrolase (TIGR01458 family)
VGKSPTRAVDASASFHGPRGESSLQTALPPVRATLLGVAIEGLLLDIDGVLAVSWEALPGAVDAMKRLRADGPPFRLITNTTTKTRADLAETLRDAGFEMGQEEIVTAVVAKTADLRTVHPGAKVYVLSDGDASEDLAGIDLVAVEDADVIVIGGACEDFTYETMNRIFRRLMAGASLVGMHRNLFWKTSEGWELDGGAYIAGLEEAADTKATICGKPEKAYFDAALAMLGVAADRVAMVGDDVVNDILGAQAAGMTGILVRTGKYREGDEDHPEGRPDHILPSFADVPAFLGS